MRKQAAAMLAISTLLAGAAAAAPGGASVRGEVVEIRDGGAVRNQGELEEITIRTRQGRNQRLLLGPSGSCEDCVRAGDRVRAKVIQGDDAGEIRRVRTLRLRRTGETLYFRNQAGELIRQRRQIGSGAGAGADAGARLQHRERLQDPASCAAGAGSRGERGRGARRR